MAKRFITTELFKDAWFMDLPNKYKLFWIFLITDCDHAGIWQVNYKTASFYVGDHLEPVECERHFKDRLIKIEDGKYWFIPKFIEFQYGYELKTSNTAVRSVIALLKRYDLVKYLPKTTITDINEKELQRSYKAPKDKDKDKDIVRAKDQDKDKNRFDDFWNLYDKKLGKDKCLKIWDSLKETEIENILSSLPDYINSTPDKQFRKNPATYLNNKCWNDEIIKKDNENGKQGNRTDHKYQQPTNSKYNYQ